MESEKTIENIKIGMIRPITAIDTYEKSQFTDIQNIVQEVLDELSSEPQLSNKKFSISVVSESLKPHIIESTIVNNIYTMPLLIVDISTLNPNVMLELGLALAFGRPVIIIKDSSTNSIFDIHSFQYIEYPTELRYPTIKSIKKQLRDSIITTYEEYTKSPEQYKSPFLKSFANIKVKKLSETEVSENDAIEEILNTVTGLKREVNKLRSETSRSSLNRRHYVINENMIHSELRTSILNLVDDAINHNLVERNIEALIDFISINLREDLSILPPSSRKDFITDTLVHSEIVRSFLS